MNEQNMNETLTPILMIYFTTQSYYFMSRPKNLSKK